MNGNKLVILEEALSSFLNDSEVADGKDGWMSDSLHLEMAKAAEAVYDSAMNTQSFCIEEEYMKEV